MHKICFLQLLASGFQCLKMVDMSYCHLRRKNCFETSFFDRVEGAQSCYFKFLLIEGDKRENAEVTVDVANDVPLVEDWPPYPGYCTK